MGRRNCLACFGGYGFNGTMGFFTQKLGIPWFIALLVIIGESFGSVALLAGFLTRFTAASLAIIMLGAITMVHLPIGFFMNWSGHQQGEGYEYHLLVIGIAAALMIIGGGKWSLDRILTERV